MSRARMTRRTKRMALPVQKAAERLQAAALLVATGLAGVFMSPSLAASSAVAAPAQAQTSGFAEAVALYQAGRYAEALQVARALALKGNAEAQAMMGVLLEHGRGTKKNLEEAASWYEKAARSGHVGAMFALAMMHLNGRLGRKDLGAAIRWAKQAAEKGHAAAAYNLGLIYSGVGGLKPDWKEAARWFHRAAERGYPAAQYNLGVLYATGRGVEKDPITAAEWFKQAALGGLPEAALEYGVLVFRGEGVVKSERIGAQWLAMAARSGNAKAMVRLARLYATGRGVERKPVEAAKWYLLARRQGEKDTFLDLYLKRLKPTQLKEAERLARAFRPTKMRRASSSTKGSLRVDTRRLRLRMLKQRNGRTGIGSGRERSRKAPEDSARKSRTDGRG